MESKMLHAAFVNSVFVYGSSGSGTIDEELLSVQITVDCKKRQVVCGSEGFHNALEGCIVMDQLLFAGEVN
jgi:hypothetical protein